MNKYILLFAILVFYSASCVDKTKLSQVDDNDSNKYKYTNELISESSPYLLQHAHNPVNWHAWNEKTLAKAKRQDKMLIISVGYSACHWCHVMEEESFEDMEVAKLMNEHFISIKVDREERPDVDGVYMTACHLTSGGSCGWPLNAIALPNGEPFWAGTYFPKDEWIKILKKFVAMKENERGKLKKFAHDITKGIQQNEDTNTITSKGEEFREGQLEIAFDDFDRVIDYQKGGRKGDIKFPMPNNWMYLLEYYHHNQNEKALKAVTTTLDEMARGGIYDHLGGGFSRYSTDENWEVPHFEKMLYDNAQLISLYSYAFQLTKKPLYKKVVYETIDFVKRELTSEVGSFYSSLDADSDGEEGKYYVWTYDEAREVLSNELDFDIFAYYYGVTLGGSWGRSKNILTVKRTLGEVAKKFNISTEEVRKSIEFSNTEMLKARQIRVRPGLDDKVLTAWNALMMKACVDAYRVFDEERFLEMAINNANFLLENVKKEDNRLNRNYKDGKSVINGFLDDYAIMTEALTGLYQATFDERWLTQAKAFTDYSFKHFYDRKEKMFNYTSNIDPPLIVRKKEINDNVIPASNSIMAKNLYRLGSYYFEELYLNTSKEMMHNVSNQVLDSRQPYFYSNWLSLYLMLMRPPYEVAIVGKDHEELRKEIDNHFLPNALLLGGEKEGDLLLLEGKSVKGETIIYVCRDKICKAPVMTVKEAIDLLK